MGQQGEAARSIAAPLAQPEPAAHQRAAFVDEGGAGGLDDGQIPGAATGGAGIGELVGGQALGKLRDARGASVIEPQQAPGVVAPPGTQPHLSVNLDGGAGAGQRERAAR